MTPETHDFTQTANAQAWAAAFMARFKDRRDQIDEADMLAWFANAIMRGHDDGFAKGQASTPTRAATDAEIGEHHWRDGLRFKRLQNGTVRIRRDADVIATIPAAEWESIVREVEPANRANGTALDGRLIASEVAGSSSPSSATATPDAEIGANELNRAENVIRAYIDEERRAGTAFNDANAIAMERFLESRSVSEALAAGICVRLREAAIEFGLPANEKLDIPIIDALRATGAHTCECGHPRGGHGEDGEDGVCYDVDIDDGEIDPCQCIAFSSRALPSSRALSETEQRWPIVDCLAKLADAADHLLKDHDCDTDGWEQISSARDAARRHIDRLTGAPK